MLEKITHLNDLFDIYSQLLTTKQKRIFELYYHEDLSLGEIAEEEEISRQAVYDTLKRVANLLEHYEEVLQIQRQKKENYELVRKIELALEKKDFNQIQQLLEILKENMR
ncbi:YlxM family DNA-binding protein [Anaerobranca gottschalkii]|uniref:UPF0122 protein SAMN03080614_103916 n=1 Tax=Anaerobranca gottschalkii DSM 13577 TaxID=1120990 RepID=A0A1I0BFW1_9FIRM|nr:sigma factor-like helix-turn-helix DNA-binding protein [Anaerobranca gottschalkii]SET05836.1 hypothetical protein SAMN03080614_103916 [Anaerobranca gottschalkii DSM 13577]